MNCHWDTRKIVGTLIFLKNKSNIKIESVRRKTIKGRNWLVISKSAYLDHATEKIIAAD